MLEMTQIHNVTDIVHGTIQCSGIESEIIYSPLYNRMHRILQNSLVYTVFPSNKTKRYEHGLGTMHLAGSMLYFSVVNACESDIDNFFEEAQNAIKEWYMGPKFANCGYLSERLKDTKNGPLINQATIMEQSGKLKLYDRFMPTNVKVENRFAYVAIFQAIRLAGLLHDIGHLPYSHIVENALKELYVNSGDFALEGEGKNFPNSLAPYFVPNSPPLHEALGEKIVELIHQRIEQELTKDNTKDLGSLILIFPLSMYFAKRILSAPEEQNGFFSDLHKIISSTIDADRLDFCSRDLLSTGVRKDVIDYERFLNSYMLKYIPSGKDHERKRFYFCPSTKMIKEVESILYRRWRIYADINYHNRVYKTELLMINCIIALGREILESTTGEAVAQSAQRQNILSHAVDGFWEIISLLKDQQAVTQLELYLIQLDDSWLDTILRRDFASRFHPTPFDKSEHGNNLLWCRLYELISGKKTYYSLIKRTDDFEQFDKEFRGCFVRKPEIVDSLLTRIDETAKGKGVPEGIVENAKPTDSTTGVAPEDRPHPLMKFLCRLRDSETIYDDIRMDEHAFVFTIVRTACEHLVGKNSFKKHMNEILPNRIKAEFHNIIDVLVGLYSFKTGYREIGKSEPLYMVQHSKTNGGSIIYNHCDFYSASSHPAALLSEKNNMPAFYLYVAPIDDIVDRAAMRKVAADACFEVAVLCIEEYLDELAPRVVDEPVGK